VSARRRNDRPQLVERRCGDVGDERDVLDLVEVGDRRDVRTELIRVERDRHEQTLTGERRRRGDPPGSAAHASGERRNVC
jgi:hypothetical protein